MVEFLEMLQFTNRVGSHALCVLLLDLDLLDGDERRRLRAQMAQEDDGVGTLSEFLALGVLALLLLVHLLGEIERRGERERR